MLRDTEIMIGNAIIGYRRRAAQYANNKQQGSHHFVLEIGFVLLAPTCSLDLSSSRLKKPTSEADAIAKNSLHCGTVAGSLSSKGVKTSAPRAVSNATIAAEDVFQE